MKYISALAVAFALAVAVNAPAKAADPVGVFNVQSMAVNQASNLGPDMANAIATATSRLAKATADATAAVIGNSVDVTENLTGINKVHAGEVSSNISTSVTQSATAVSQTAGAIATARSRNAAAEATATAAGIGNSVSTTLNAKLVNK